MNEHFLQYLWKYSIFSEKNFKDTEGNPVEIIDCGEWNQNSGPDFLNGKIRIQNLVLAGNIELHLKSSDWEIHQHTQDENYQNIILHVVYKHDKEIEFLKEKNIPTLELKKYIGKNISDKYSELYQKNNFIPCENLFSKEDVPFHFAEENLLRKLDQKSIEIEQQLEKYKNDYEAVLFHYIAYAFGLKINADIFKEMAESEDFSIIRKISKNIVQFEAFFFGKSGWLNETIDEQTKIWKAEYDFLRNKFQTKDIVFYPKFLRLRPANFPTLRLSQLAHLYHQEQKLFSKIMGASHYNQLKKILESVKASEYWNNHYTFGKVSSKQHEKKLSDKTIDLILLNAILPVKYTYHKHQKENIAEEIIEMYQSISAENNSIIEKWKKLGAGIRNAAESQAFLFQYKNFCVPKKCLNCSIGYRILKTS